MSSRPVYYELYDNGELVGEYRAKEIMSGLAGNIISRSPITASWDPLPGALSDRAYRPPRSQSRSSGQRSGIRPGRGY